jgi:hypothetical protein
MIFSFQAPLGARCAKSVLILALATLGTADAENLLSDGTGFETGQDGWEVMAYRFIQDPAKPGVRYINPFDLDAAPADTIPEGNRCLALRGDPWLQEHEVRWPMTELEPNTDYTFSIYTKGVIDGIPLSDCEPLGVSAELRVSNGDSDALRNNSMRLIEGGVRSCWSRLIYHFNTADIEARRLHPEGKYSFLLVLNTTRQSWSNQHSYTIYLDAVQLERGTAATRYGEAESYDIGIDVNPTQVDDPVEERALRQYKLFEEDEPLQFRYWVHAAPQQPRPRAVGYRVIDAYMLDDNGKPKVWIEQHRLADPDEGVGTFEIDAADLAGGSGIYKVIVGAPFDHASETLIIGVLKPQSDYMSIDPEGIIFGAQVANYRYVHMPRNNDGYDGNDLPECDDAPYGHPDCTTKRLLLAGPDPALSFTILRRLGINHLRIKHVYLPVGYAPISNPAGEWDLLQVQWFTELAHGYGMHINAMLGDKADAVEDPAAEAVLGYPAWMSPGESGWEAFLAGNKMAYEKLSEAIPGLVTSWEVFNEPTSVRNNFTVEQLIQLDSLATDVFHVRDPGSRTVGFGLTGMSPRGLISSGPFPQGRDALFRDFIRAGGLSHMDVASIRLGNTSELGVYPDSAYTDGLAMRLTYCGRALYTEVNRLVDAYDPDHSGFDFWVTETNFMSGSGYQDYNVVNPADYGDKGRRVDSAREVARLLSQSMSNAAATGVKRIFYFSFENQEYSGIFNAPYRSLVDVFGSPRAGQLAYYNVIRFLSGAHLVEQSLPDGKRVFLFFENGDEDIVVVYHPDPSGPVVPFTVEQPALIFDMWGNRIQNPKMSPEPVFIVGRNIDPLALVRSIEAQMEAAVAMAGDAGDPTLRFQQLPSVNGIRWDFECAPHMWLSTDNDLRNRTITVAKRFDDDTQRGVIISGETSYGYNDNIAGTPTAVHSDFTVFTGAQLKTAARYLTEQIVATSGYLRQYLVIKDRAETQTGTFLLATNDDRVTTDPRYRIADFDLHWVDLPESRFDVPKHDVDLLELLSENGFEVDNGTEYLLDLVVYAMNDDAFVGLDNVAFVATPSE